MKTREELNVAGEELNEAGLEQVSGGAVVIVDDSGKGMDLRRDDDNENLGRYDVPSEGCPEPISVEELTGL